MLAIFKMDNKELKDCDEIFTPFMTLWKDK